MNSRSHQNHTVTNRKSYPIQIIGILTVYNEHDIIEQTLDYMKSQRIQLVVIDNGSTDGTYELLKAKSDNTIIHLERIETEEFELAFLLHKLYDLALKYNPDWLIKLDADEFLEAPSQYKDLREAIERESKKHNLIQFNNFQFWPTETDIEESDDIREKMKYYSWNDDWQFRCWKHYPGTTIHETGGHLPIFPKEIKVHLSPNKFTLRHYCIRSVEHGMKKVFEERLKRYSKKEMDMGWHKRFKKFERDRKSFIIPSEKLFRYNNDEQWMLEKRLNLSSAYDSLPKKWDSETVRTLMTQFKIAYKDLTRKN
jgi:glycosyltransferase involved in cell wall biosynthesis